MVPPKPVDPEPEEPIKPEPTPEPVKPDPEPVDPTPEPIDPVKPTPDEPVKPDPKPVVPDFDDDYEWENLPKIPEEEEDKSEMNDLIIKASVGLLAVCVIFAVYKCCSSSKKKPLAYTSVIDPYGSNQNYQSFATSENSGGSYASKNSSRIRGYNHGI